MHSDDPRTDRRDQIALDELVEHITVDAYRNDGYWSFPQTFEDDVGYPVPASVVGVGVTVIEIDFDGDERRGLTGIVERDGRTWTVSLLDLEIPSDQTRLCVLSDAYRRWLGMHG